MSDKTELSGDEAVYWYERLENESALQRVFDASTVEVTQDELSRKSVHEYADGRVRVRLKYVESEGDFVSATGEFEADGALSYVELDDGVVAAPLAGHGEVWRYEDGRIIQSSWIS